MVSFPIVASIGHQVLRKSKKKNLSLWQETPPPPLVWSQVPVPPPPCKVHLDVFLMDTMNFIGTSCEMLRLSTFRSSCEKLAKLNSPFQMACQKVKTKLSPIPYYLKVVGMTIHTPPTSRDVMVTSLI